MFPSLGVAGVSAVFTLGTEESEPSSALHIQLTITSDLQGLTDILGPSPSMSPSAAILQHVTDQKLPSLVSDLICFSNRTLTFFRKATDNWSSVGRDEYPPSCGVPQTDFILGF